MKLLAIFLIAMFPFLAISQGRLLNLNDRDTLRRGIDTLKQTKEGVFYVVPYTTTLRFGRNQVMLNHTQTGPEVFNLASDSQYVGKKIYMTVTGTNSGDSLTFPFDPIWLDSRRPQLNKTNDYELTMMPGGKVSIRVTTRDRNFANLFKLRNGITSFSTQAGFEIDHMYAQPDVPITLTMGTTSGGVDIINHLYLRVGIHPIIVYKKFDTVTNIYVSGASQNTGLYIPNPGFDNN